MAERKLASAQAEKNEAENTKKKLERELEKAMSYIQDEKKVKVGSKDREARKTVQLKKDMSLNDQMEKEKAALLEEKRALESKVEEARTALSSNSDRKDVGQSKRDLEAKLADLTAEFDLDHLSKLKDKKKKTKEKKDELVKKISKDKEKPERDIKRLEAKQKELLDKLKDSN